MCLAMAQIARRGTDQFGDFVGMLKFGAIPLKAPSPIPEKNLRGRLDNPRFPRSSRPKKQQVADWPSRRGKSGAKTLIEVSHRLHSFFLPDDLGPQQTVEVACIVAADCGIQLLSGGPHLVSPCRFPKSERQP